MQTARVYKVNIRENILRQVIFTDRNLFLGFVVLIFGLIWKAGVFIPQDIKIFSGVFSTGLALVVFTVKIDRQALFRIFPRLLEFYFKNKKHRY